MKKILSFSPSRIFILCGLGLALTLGAFWHHQHNQVQLNRLNVLNQGVGTCFNRVSQTFTAMMIKDMNSSYLDRGFMGLSDECLNESIQGINPFKKDMGKGYETLNKLIGEVHFFHEKVLKIHAPMLAGHNLNASMAPITDRFSRMETLRTSLMDEIEGTQNGLSHVQANDEILMGIGLLLFVIGLSVLSLQEFNRIQLRREIEGQALSLLNGGQANVGAMVDQLVERALSTQGMVVTNQVFKDYHGDLLERMNARFAKDEAQESTPLQKSQASAAEEKAEINEGPSTSFKEILVSLQNIHGKENLQVSDVRDVQLAVDFEASEQLLNAAINKLMDKNANSKKIQISNQVHSDRSIINLFLAENTFTADELEYGGTNPNAVASDMNLMILKEMVNETGAQWHLENKSDRQGKISGMAIRLTFKRSREKSKLVSVVKGKKKDLVQLMN